mmetsp:Transcript_23308/g.68868  ORF Transcript_23308/g.68868 Transcript_23308/m.68868 type:complete len:337 (+) Transcript_23308:1619-2629(+)
MRVRKVTEPDFPDLRLPCLVPLPMEDDTESLLWGWDLTEEVEADFLTQPSCCWYCCCLRCRIPCSTLCASSDPSFASATSSGSNISSVGSVRDDIGEATPPSTTASPDSLSARVAASSEAFSPLLILFGFLLLPLCLPLDLDRPRKIFITEVRLRDRPRRRVRLRALLASPSSLLASRLPWLRPLVRLSAPLSLATALTKKSSPSESSSESELENAPSNPLLVVSSALVSTRLAGESKFLLPPIGSLIGVSALKATSASESSSSWVRFCVAGVKPSPPLALLVVSSALVSARLAGESKFLLPPIGSLIGVSALKAAAMWKEAKSCAPPSLAAFSLP